MLEGKRAILAVLAVLWIRGLAVCGAESDSIGWSDPRWLVKPGPNYPGRLNKPIPLTADFEQGPVVLQRGKGKDSLTLRPVNASYSIVLEQKLAIPHRLQYDFRGLGSMTSCVVSVHTRKHWQGNAGLLALYANDKRRSTHPMGWYQAVAPVEYRPEKWYRVVIENYVDHSKVRVNELDSGLLLADYDHVSHTPVATDQLVLAKVDEKGPVAIEFSAVTLQTGLTLPPVPILPAFGPGFHLLFHDPFGGQAIQWGSPRYLPGAFTLPKFDFRTYATCLTAWISDFTTFRLPRPTRWSAETSSRMLS